ncbi:malonyl-CoA decarboxylase [Algihabitans albus]|uniref:malonyl-CoA decarboxylase n=1 Tax=Algihabitans albus TaxID=2164067 RepID=UPI000E5C8386|nr:malonyl-CoA decarboxylase [Algihabitans albus]
MTTSDQQQAVKEGFFERAFGNVSSAWRDIAATAARTVGVTSPAEAARNPDALEKLMADCLKARGGEVAARGRAAELGRIYLQLEEEGRHLFLEVLATRFAVDRTAVETAMADYAAAADEEARLTAQFALRQALVPPRVKLLTQFNGLPEGVKFLADLRADLLPIAKQDAYLSGLDSDLHELLTSWFDVGFLDLRQIDWSSPASLLEKLIAYEAVHEIRSWDDLRNRLDSDRRCFALFHPRMPDEPLAFIEVALTKGIAGSVQALLDEQAPLSDPRDANTAIFYSISNTQRGLQGISFGDYLIKMVVRELSGDFPNLKVFATLSPVPGLRKWLDTLDAEVLEQAMSEEERGGLRALGGSDATEEALRAVLEAPEWAQDAVTTKALEGLLTRIAARYFTETREDGLPLDPVARFHLRNGARLERINWLGDTAPKGLRQSAGIMVNYRYILDDIEKNHESFVSKGTVVMSADVKALAKRARESGGGAALRRLRLG